MNDRNTTASTAAEFEFMDLTCLGYNHGDSMDSMKNKTAIPPQDEFQLIFEDNDDEEEEATLLVQGFIEPEKVHLIADRICPGSSSHQWVSDYSEQQQQQQENGFSDCKSVKRVIFDSDLRACFPTLRALLYRHDDHQLNALEFRNHKLEYQDIAALVRGTGVTSLSFHMNQQGPDIDYLFKKIPHTVTKLSLSMDQVINPVAPNVQNYFESGNVHDMFPGPSTMILDIANALCCLPAGIQELTIDFQGGTTVLLNKLLTSIASSLSLQKLTVIGFHGRSASEMIAVLTRYLEIDTGLEALKLEECSAEDVGNCGTHIQAFAAAVQQHGKLQELILDIDFYCSEPDFFRPYGYSTDTGIQLMIGIMHTVILTRSNKETTTTRFTKLGLSSSTPENIDLFWSSQSKLCALFEAVLHIIRNKDTLLSTFQLKLKQCCEIDHDDVRVTFKNHLEEALAQNTQLVHLELYPLLYKSYPDDKGVGWYESIPDGALIQKFLTRNQWLRHAREFAASTRKRANALPPPGLWANAIAAMGRPRRQSDNLCSTMENDDGGGCADGHDANYLLIHHLIAACGVCRAPH